jgi:hypothetical protein
MANAYGMKAQHNAVDQHQQTSQAESKDLYVLSTLEERRVRRPGGKGDCEEVGTRSPAARLQNGMRS